MANTRHQVPVAQLEFDDGGNTIWIHNANGETVLRLKTVKKIEVQRDCINCCAHTDIITPHPIVICLPSKKSKRTKNAERPS